MTYQLAENLLIIVGLGFMIFSMTKYYLRTRDKSLFKKMWFMKLDLNRVEYLLNRIGIYILVMGIIMRFMNNFLLL